jgi:type I site-specific restriction-modification system R (restriction) subunit
MDRWNRDKTDNLQYAFFNGVGYESWENVWGIWNGITPRDAEALLEGMLDKDRLLDFVENFILLPSLTPHMNLRML